jgi:hypothetical protein
LPIECNGAGSSGPKRKSTRPAPSSRIAGKVRQKRESGSNTRRPPGRVDASTVDQASVRFGMGQALPQGRGQLADVNGDGRVDLLLHFRTQDAGIQCGDTTVSITGQTLDGVPIQGSDAITTVGCNSASDKQEHP